MNSKPEIAFFWFRRDLRLDDNVGLFQALNADVPVIPLFIFDDAILESLPKDDARVSFIYECLSKINHQLNEIGSSILIKKGKTQDVWEDLISEFNIKVIYTNKDYEPYAIKRDAEIKSLLETHQIEFNLYKDQVIFEELEITKSDGLPYTIYTPYKNKWMENFILQFPLAEFDTKKYFSNFYKYNFDFPTLEKIGFVESNIKVKPHNLKQIQNYHETRNFPALDNTSYLSPHLRFGTVSIRKLVDWAVKKNQVFLNELIWREFFMQILFSFPKVVTHNFKSAYDGIQWRNNEAEFEMW